MPSTDALPARPDPRALFDGGIPLGDLAPDPAPDSPPGERAPRSPPLHAEDLAAFLARPIPPRGMLLDPVIPEQGLTMLYSERGVGKTHCSLGMAFAVATGGSFLRWAAPRPRRTVVVDGEMPAALLQERLAAILRAAAPVAPADGYLRLVSPDLQDAPMPDLSTPEGQARFAPVFDGADLVVLDNLSTLCHAGKENEAESWTAMQRFLLDLRRRGKSVLICHHAGKGGGQRGTSKREDALDVVLALRRPADYAAADGARFELHLEKARHVFGAAARPFEARLEMAEDGEGAGAARWTVGEVASARYDELRGYIAQGLSVRRIAALTGLSRSAVGRLRREIVADAGEADDADGEEDEADGGTLF